MSRKMYTQKTKAQNVVYGPAVSTTVQNWAFETIQANFALHDPERGSRVPFTTKNWVKIDNPAPLDDGKDEKVEFLAFNIPVAEPAAPDADALTASDIRGAVGGEAIPGIASETYDDKNESPAVQTAGAEPSAVSSVEPSAGPSVEPSVETSAEPSVEPSHVSAEPKTDGDEQNLAEVASAEPSVDPETRLDGDGDVIMD